MYFGGFLLRAVHTRGREKRLPDRLLDQRGHLIDSVRQLPARHLRPTGRRGWNMRALPTGDLQRCELV